MISSHCCHCYLPVGRRGYERQVGGEDHCFCCYGCCLAFQVAHDEHDESHAAWLLIRLGTGAFLAMNIMLFSLLLYSGTLDADGGKLRPLFHMVLWGLATPVLVILGGPFVREAWQDACRLCLGSSALISLGAGAAYGYSAFAVVTGSAHVYFDTATMVLVLFTLGRYLEAAGRAKAMRSVAPMLAPERQWVRVIDGGTEQLRPVRDLIAGTMILVRPGETIGVDGTVAEGSSFVNEALITGESRPVQKSPGEKVLAGSINYEGPLVVRSRGQGNATRWRQITRSVREALARKSDAERVGERVAGAFVPAVLALAGITVIYWTSHVPFGEALLHGLAVLVVACPCALGLAAPLATSIGIGRLARRGCLVRGGDVLEAIARLHTIAFDKTGTLTMGQPRLASIETDGTSADEVLRLAGTLERNSEHPFANAITAAAEVRDLPATAARNVRAVPGHGIKGEIDGASVAAGSLQWLRDLGFVMPSGLAALSKSLEQSESSLVYLGRSGDIIGVLSLEDRLLPEAPTTVATIRALGLEIVLLSGDRTQTAHRAAKAAGIDNVYSELSPEAKQALIARQSRGKAMVGDGLNDAPVLAVADVGFAVGSAVELARQAADVVLPKGGLNLVPWVIALSRSVYRTILVNFGWAFAYNAAALALAASGHLRPVLAAALMAGSSLFVVLNSLRLERFPEKLRESVSPIPMENGTAAGLQISRPADLP